MADPLAERFAGDIAPAVAEALVEVAWWLERGDLESACGAAATLHREIERSARRDAGLDAGAVRLTGREYDTLRLLADGAVSPKDVARLLGVTRHTTKSHIKSIYLKLGAHSRAEAVEAARRRGILPWPEHASVAARRSPQRHLRVVASGRRPSEPGSVPEPRAAGAVR